ncbi:MAG TPA: BsuPI-related putative proteinase inhibitor [Gemmatimonadales bacterium]|nr:BsuPI-related putative proteinase inhibitor [Gemmatimonadales bacterium]
MLIAAVVVPSFQPSGARVQGEQDTLELRLVVPPQVRVGQEVAMRLLVRNRTGRTLDLYLRGRAITFDVIVARDSGAEVWRRLEGEVIPAVLQVHTLRPGEQIEAGASWNQRRRGGELVQPGRYRARALLLVEAGVIETPAVSFRITDR